MVSKKQKSRWYVKLHVIFTAIIFGVYFLSCFFYNPYFFAQDIKDKLNVFADTIDVTATVLTPPVTPVVNVQSLCLPQSTITLGWGDDIGTTSFDITRNNTLLVSGLTSAQYQDVTIVPGATYRYTVISYGPMGSGIATSSEMSVVSRYDCEGLNFVPTLTVTSIGSQSVVGSFVAHSVKDATPRITGTSNIPNATIEWTLIGDKIITGITTVNSNGFWEFTPPMKLKDRNYILSIRSFDNNTTMQSQQDITFSLDAQHDTTSNNSTKNHENIIIAHPTASVIGTPKTSQDKENYPQRENGNQSFDSNQLSQSPIEYSLTIDTSDEIYSGESLSIHIAMNDVREGKVEADFTILIRDAVGNIVYEDTSVSELFSSQIINRNIPIPSLLDAGVYTLDVIVRVGDYEIVRSQDISIKELPLFQIGGNHVITYQQFLRNIGWIAFAGATATGVMSLLWLREYQIFGVASRHFVTNNLNNKGFVKKRRGVSK